MPGKIPLSTALLASLLCAAAIRPGTSRACSCDVRAQPEAFERAAAVFEGRVAAIEPVKRGEDVAPQFHEVRIEVTRAWKGVEDEIVLVRTRADEAACGFNFQKGESYLVYASATDRGLDVSLCSRTVPMDRAGEDLNRLGVGVVPVDPKKGAEKKKPKSAAPGAGRGGCASCSVGSVPSPVTGTAAWLATTGVVLSVLLRRRTRRGKES
jgi:MYXO-CTERM domain-containing protein